MAARSTGLHDDVVGIVIIDDFVIFITVWGCVVAVVAVIVISLVLLLSEQELNVAMNLENHLFSHSILHQMAARSTGLHTPWWCGITKESCVLAATH